MSSPTSTEVNGSYWLFELTYGVEKAHQYREVVEQFRGKAPAEIIDAGDEIIKKVAKLERAELSLRSLVGSVIGVTPTTDVDNFEVIEGKVDSFDLKNGTIQLATDEGLSSLPFCTIENDPDIGLAINPIVSLHTETEFKL